MSQYKISKEILDYTKSIKVDLNEFDFDHHPDIYKTISENIVEPKSITHYSNIYNKNTKEILKKISDYNDVNDYNILISAGSDDALEYIINKYISKDTHVIIFVPSYNYFEIVVKRHTKNIHYIPMDFNNKELYDISECLEFYSDILDNAIVYIVNPSNPLGTLCSSESIKNALSKYNKTTFIIDEAYIELCKKETCVKLINYKNIIISRTFSKAYGLAGIRLGYLIAHQDTISNIKILYNEKNTTDLAKSAGIAIFNNISYYENIVDNIIKSRVSFENFLQEMKIYYIHSHANFVSFYIGKNRKKFLEILESKLIYIRDRHTQVDMAGFVRITIGKEEHMEIVKDIIKDNITIFDDKSNTLVSYYSNKNTIWTLKKLFKKIIKILNKNNFTYWLDGGTLLGIYRNKGIIPWDDDIDMGMLMGDVEKLLSLETEFKSQGIRLQLNRTKCYYQFDFGNSSDKINDIHIDIFPYNLNENNDYVNNDPRFIISDDIKCNFTYPINDLFPLKKYSFYNILDTYVPCNTEQILTKNLTSDFMEIAYIDENTVLPLNNAFYA